MKTTPFSTLISISLSLTSIKAPFKLVTNAKVTESLLVTASCIVLMTKSFSFKLSRDFSRFSAPFCERVVKLPMLLIKS